MQISGSREVRLKLKSFRCSSLAGSTLDELTGVLTFPNEFNSKCKPSNDPHDYKVSCIINVIINIVLHCTRLLGKIVWVLVCKYRSR